MLRILLADDHEIVREGARRILECFPDMQVVGEAATGAEALDMCMKTPADVLLLDLDMPELGGLDILERVTNIQPGLRVIIFTMHDNVEHALLALKNGAVGFMLKGSKPGELPTAIKKVAAGEKYISPKMMEALALKQLELKSDNPLDLLSKRELQVLAKIARFKKLKEIAGEMDLSVGAVSTYKKRAMEKLGLEGTPEIMAFAEKHALKEKGF